MTDRDEAAAPPKWQHRLDASLDALRDIPWPSTQFLESLVDGPINGSRLNHHPDTWTSDEATVGTNDSAALVCDLLALSAQRSGDTRMRALAEAAKRQFSEGDRPAALDTIIRTYRGQLIPPVYPQMVAEQTGLFTHDPHTEGYGYIWIHPRRLMGDNTPEADPGARFYLNPPIHQVAEVCRRITEAAMSTQESDLTLKYLDPADLVGDYPAFSDRTDRAIVYAPAERRGRVLELLQQVKQELPTAFSGRPLPELAIPVEAGIAYAEEGNSADGNSNQRAGFLNGVRANFGRS